MNIPRFVEYLLIPYYFVLLLISGIAYIFAWIKDIPYRRRLKKNRENFKKEWPYSLYIGDIRSDKGKIRVEYIKSLGADKAYIREGEVYGEEFAIGYIKDEEDFIIAKLRFNDAGPTIN